MRKKETFYFFTLPMRMLYDKTIDGYEKNGLNHKVLYSYNSMVEYNEENGLIEVMLEEKYLMKYSNSHVKC
ncbi:MAG: hypothetical protein ACI4DY_11220 [Monoglobaceae bacterium]